MLATGDTRAAATAAARAAGIGTIHSGLLPKGKSDLVQELRRERGPVAMVGDGINDAPALAAADIGIAVATGTGAALAAADTTLVHGGVGAVADAVLLARATRRIIRQNLGWAFGYHQVLVPLAAAGILPPVLAAAARPPARSPWSVVCCGSAASARAGCPGRHRRVRPDAGTGPDPGQPHPRARPAASNGRPPGSRADGVRP